MLALSHLHPKNPRAALTPPYPYTRHTPLSFPELRAALALVPLFDI
jgi:hypothetical protein